MDNIWKWNQETTTSTDKILKFKSGTDNIQHRQKGRPMCVSQYDIKDRNNFRMIWYWKFVQTFFNFSKNASIHPCFSTSKKISLTRFEPGSFASKPPWFLNPNHERKFFFEIGLSQESVLRIWTKSATLRMRFWICHCVLRFDSNDQLVTHKTHFWKI